MDKKIFKIFSDPKIVTLTPIVCSFLFEYANLGQIWKIWIAHTAAGQNIWSWVALNISLFLYLNFYRVCAPKEKFAIWATAISILVGWVLIFSIIWWRWIV